MTFLNPTILFGLLATAIPLVLHFINLKKIKRIEFSTLAFLKELQKSKIKKIKIKQILLLLLRILIILFLVFAFARPTIENSNVGFLDSGKKTKSIIILDNSNSMGVVQSRGSLFNQAKGAIKKIVKEFSSTNDFSVIVSSDGSQIIRPINSQSDIESIKISNRTIPLAVAIKKSISKLSKIKSINKEILIFSDFQKSTFLQNDSTGITFPNNIGNIFLFNFGKERINNLAISDLQIDNQIIEINKEISISARVSGDYNGSSVVSLFLSGKRVAQRGIEKSDSKNRIVKFQTDLQKNGLIEMFSEVEDERVQFDNRFYSSLVVPEKIKLLLSSSRKSAVKYLSALFKTATDKQFDVSFVKVSDLAATNLDEYKIIILVGSDVNRPSELQRYVENGGNVILFPDDNSRKPSRLYELLNLPKVKEIVNHVANSKTGFGKVDLEHPIFNGIFTDGTEKISSPLISRFVKFSSIKRGRIIISLEDGSLMLGDFKRGSGKILLWNLSPNMEWSDFPVRNIFAPIMLRSIYYLSTPINNGESIFPGDVISVNISRRKSNQIKLIKPDNSEVLINVENPKSKYLEYFKTDEIGNYKFYSSDELLDVKSVNINPKESNFEKLSMSKLKSDIIKSKNDAIIIDSNEDFVKVLKSEKYGSELWKIFLAIVFVLALIEMFVSRSSKKDIVELER